MNMMGYKKVVRIGKNEWKEKSDFILSENKTVRLETSDLVGILHDTNTIAC